MTKDELQVVLALEAEAVIAEIVKAVNNREMNLTEIEDVALQARQEFGRRMAERLVKLQVDQKAHVLPVNGEGRTLHPKGKKRKLSIAAPAR